MIMDKYCKLITGVTKSKKELEINRLKAQGKFTEELEVRCLANEIMREGRKQNWLIFLANEYQKDRERGYIRTCNANQKLRTSKEKYQKLKWRSKQPRF